MRIRQLSAKNFGKFEDYSIDFTESIAVIKGQNEAGKSTVFDMIKILLFGIDDESNPEERIRFIKHGEEKARITGEFEKADGTKLNLERIITISDSNLSIVENFAPRTLGNEKAPIVSHLTKEVYENIYALDFHTMSAIRDDVWQGIKDEFMGADMSKDLLSANEAISLASNNANEIHSNNSSPSLLSDMEKEKADLQKQYERTQTSQQEASSDYMNLEKTNREIIEMQNQIEFENAFLAEAEKMNGLKTEISKIRTLAQEAGDLSQYKKWLPNIKEEYSRIKDDALSTRELLEQAKKISLDDEPVEAIPKFDEKYEKALENRDIIEKLKYQQPDTESKAQSNNLQDEYTEANANWHTLLRETLVIDADERETQKALDEINNVALAKKLDDYNDMRNLLNKEVKESNIPVKKGLRTSFFILSLIVSIVLILIGATLWGFDALKSFMSPVVITQYWFNMVEALANLVPLTNIILADIICGFGLILMLTGIIFIKGKSKRLRFKISDQKISVIKQETEELRLNFEKELFGLAFPKLRLKKPDPRMIEDITELKRAKVVLQDAERKHEEFSKVSHETQIVNEVSTKGNDEINNLAAMLLDEPTTNADENLIALKNLVKAAETAKAKYEIDMTNRPTQEIVSSPESENHLLDELETKCTEAVYKYDELTSLLGPDTDSMIDEIQQRYDKINTAVVLRDDIMSRHSDFKDITARLEQLETAGWPYGSDTIEQANARIDELRTNIADVQSKIGLMEDGVKNAVLGERPSEIASKIMVVDEKIKQMEQEHDKLLISQQIIKLGHDIFSKLHQPEVLSRASYYLSILTGGKYSEMELSEDTSSITVLTEEGKYKTPYAARLSQATCEQIYLSIRLSVIESFDMDTEVMPIILDEALITWDSDRLTAGLDLLAQVARKRQVLIFTCHNFIVDILKVNQPDAQIIEI